MSKEKKDRKIAEIKADFKERLEAHIDDIVDDETFISKLAQDYQKKNQEITGLFQILMETVE